VSKRLLFLPQARGFLVPKPRLGNGKISECSARTRKRFFPLFPRSPAWERKKILANYVLIRLNIKKILFPAETSSYCINAVKGIFMTFFFAEKKLILFNLLILR